MAKIRPFLKWAGGKYNCLDKVLKALPQGSRLIEPFAGSGVVFMNAGFSAYILGESNQDLIHIFSTLKDQGDEFIDYCQQYFQPKFNNKETYYSLRSEFNTLEHGPHRAALFLYLNRHGYNGLCRYNSTGIYNVPFGLYAKPYFPRNEMQLFHTKSQQVDFVHGDFRKTMQLAQTGDVIYCDPPYVALTDKAQVLPYTAKQFKAEDQIALAELAQETAARGIPVIISNHDTQFTRDIYQHARIESFPVARYISCQGINRQPVRELLAVFK